MSIFAAFIIALAISLLFTPSYRRKGSSLSGLFIFFFTLFLAGIAAHHWIIPFGPVYWGVSWFPMLFIILVFSFLFSAPSPHNRNEAKADSGESAAALSIGIFVWFILILLVIAILFGYFR